MHRVRFLSLRHQSFPADIGSAAIFDALRLSLPTPHLFPNLRNLRWSFDQRPQLSFVTLLLAPGITDIVLGTFKSIRDLTVMGGLAARCPLLRRVELVQVEILDIDQSRAVSSFIRGLKQVQTLDIRNLDGLGFEHLAGLSHLTNLTVTCPNSIRDSSLTHDTSVKFPALESLVLKSTPFQTAMTFIQTLSRTAPTPCTPFTSLSIAICPPPGAAGLMDIYAALKKNLPAIFLTDLSIKSDSLPLTQTSQHKTTIAAIRHLLIFRKLTSVSLRAPTGFQIDDNMILRMAEAGPCLESLQMLSPSPVRGLKPTPRTTLLSLLYLAENCPRLEYLKLAVDASIIPNLDDRYFSAWPHSLFYWEVANSLITSPLRVARFLSGVFPLLEEVFVEEMQDAAHPPDVAESLRALWGEVLDMLRLCLEMREEERSRGARKSRALSRQRSKSVELEQVASFSQVWTALIIARYLQLNSILDPSKASISRRY
ncbi:hypothetical protein B0H14DRAFT_3896187 [Mycena olivaceomarginata]|nr:hypothetical protein B0H14DRAFT_3896187 [Mycena olivaceomarginata]